MQDEQTALLIDSWKNLEALDRHHSSSIMKEIMYLREEYDLHMKVERFIMEEAGVPRTDAKYIRK